MQILENIIEYGKASGADICISTGNGVVGKNNNNNIIGVMGRYWVLIGVFKS